MEKVQGELDNFLLRTLRNEEKLFENTVVNMLDRVEKRSDQSQKESKKRLIQALTLSEDITKNVNEWNLGEFILVYFMQKKPREKINYPKLCNIFSSLDEAMQKGLYAYKNERLWSSNAKKRK